MAAYEPYCDGVFECWTTKHLEEFVKALERPRRITPEEKAFLLRYTDEPAAWCVVSTPRATTSAPGGWRNAGMDPTPQASEAHEERMARFSRT